MEFSTKQRKLLKSFLGSSNYFTLLVGAIRSGKSYIAVLAFLIYTQSIGRKRLNIIAGRNLRAMEVELLSTFEKLASGLGSSYIYKRTTGILLINSVKYIVVAGHDENSYKRVQSITAGSALVDEIQLIPESFVKQIQSRLSFADSKLLATCNPESPTHWLKKDYIDKGKIDELVPFTLDDNLTIADKVKERYKRIFSGVFYERNILGKWVKAEGVIYQNYRVENVRVDKTNTLYSDIGIDYGIKGTTAYEKLTYLRDGRCVIEKSYNYNGKDRIKTDKELVDDLIKFIGDSRIQRVYVDPSASSFIAELRKRRLRLSVIEAANSVVPGIKTVMNGFSSQTLIVLDNKENKPLIEELGTYSWMPGIDDKPVKEDDHHCDALRYAYYTRNKNGMNRIVKLPRGL